MQGPETWDGMEDGTRRAEYASVCLHLSCREAIKNLLMPRLSWTSSSLLEVDRYSLGHTVNLNAHTLTCRLIVDIRHMSILVCYKLRLQDVVIQTLMRKSLGMSCSSFAANFVIVAILVFFR